VFYWSLARGGYETGGDTFACVRVMRVSCPGARLFLDFFEHIRACDGYAYLFANRMGKSRTSVTRALLQS
jgi:hypothetical protein